VLKQQDQFGRVLTLREIVGGHGLSARGALAAARNEFEGQVFHHW
jgi:hypothetical protein